MAEALREYFEPVEASCSTMAPGTASPLSSAPALTYSNPPGGIDWVITNPPFNLALEFALRGFELAREGVAPA